MINLLTATKYEELVKASDNPAYWNGRWSYMSIVIEWLREFEYRHILEVGANGIQLCDKSHTVGLTSGKYVHNLTQTPWPIESARYDVLVGLQVWEHLLGAQQAAFQEARRVANHVILSLPLGWNCPHDIMHHNISRDEVVRWAGGLEPSREMVIGATTAPKRLLCLWE